MTQKELAYVEDAIRHESTIISVLEEAEQTLQDESLVDFVRENKEKHSSMKEELMNLLEEKANE